MHDRRSQRSSFSLAAFALLLALCSACIARHISLSEKGLTCADAERIAIDTVRRMGYTITETTKPTPGSPGMIIGTRMEGINTHGLMVTVACSTLGAEVEAKSDQTGLSDLNFASEFRRNFEAATTSRPPPRPPAQSGVDVLLTPERGSNVADIAVDLGTAGILPVSIRITNHTPRAYRFQVKGVRLQTAAGARIAALGNDALSAQVGSDTAAALRQKTVHDQEIKPNETLTGLLFFPFNSYTSARVELIDQQSGEGEGFAIEL